MDAGDEEPHGVPTSSATRLAYNRRLSFLSKLSAVVATYQTYSSHSARLRDGNLARAEHVEEKLRDLGRLTGPRLTRKNEHIVVSDGGANPFLVGPYGQLPSRHKQFLPFAVQVWPVCFILAFTFGRYRRLIVRFWRVRLRPPHLHYFVDTADRSYAFLTPARL